MLYPLIVPEPPTGDGAVQASVTLCAVPAGMPCGLAPAVAARAMREKQSAHKSRGVIVNM